MRIVSSEARSSGCNLSSNRAQVEVSQDRLFDGAFRVRLQAK